MLVINPIPHYLAVHLVFIHHNFRQFAVREGHDIRPDRTGRHLEFTGVEDILVRLSPIIAGGIEVGKFFVGHPHPGLLNIRVVCTTAQQHS